MWGIWRMRVLLAAACMAFSLQAADHMPEALTGTGDTVLRDIAFENVTGDVMAEKPVEMANVENICFEGFRLRSGHGKKSQRAVNRSDGWERGL